MQIAAGVLEENGIVRWAVLGAVSWPADVSGARVSEQLPYLINSLSTLRPEGNPIGVSLMVLILGEPEPGLGGWFPGGVKAVKSLALPGLLKTDGGENFGIERPDNLEIVDAQGDMLKGVIN